MVDVSIVNETSPEANWNRQAGGQADKPVYWEATPSKMTTITITVAFYVTVVYL